MSGQRSRSSSTVANGQGVTSLIGPTSCHSSMRLSSAAVIGAPPSGPSAHLFDSKAIRHHLLGTAPFRGGDPAPERRSRGLDRSGLDESERRQVSDAPAVNNLSAERNLVVALQVAVAVRITELDQLE